MGLLTRNTVKQPQKWRKWRGAQSAANGFWSPGPLNIEPSNGASASLLFIGGNPSSDSMVRTTLTVVEKRLSTNAAPEAAWGAYLLTTRATLRCASTWSAPFCASSSRMKIAVSFQNAECDTARSEERRVGKECRAR